MSEEAELRRRLVRMGHLLYTRQLAHGSAGNLSVKLEDGTILGTPTNSSLGDLDADRISKVSPDGEHISGDRPTKESSSPPRSARSALPQEPSSTCTPPIRWRSRASATSRRRTSSHL